MELLVTDIFISHREGLIRLHDGEQDDKRIKIRSGDQLGYLDSCYDAYK